MVPLWNIEGEGLSSVQTDQHGLRSICLGYIDSNIVEDDKVLIEIRGKAIDAVVVPHHLRSEAPPYARPIVVDHEPAAEELPLVRMLSVMDPAFRYAEHRESKAFYDADIFYYQGTEFIGEVERMLEEEFR